MIICFEGEKMLLYALSWINLVQVRSDQGGQTGKSRQEISQLTCITYPLFDMDQNILHIF